jgi:hypothetical protein
MSDKTKETVWSVSKVSATVAMLGLMLSITKGVWTVASDWGSFTEWRKSIDSRLEQHVTQTKQFQTEMMEWRKQQEREMQEIRRRVGVSLRGDFE